ncbi:hypothetical protein AB0G79_27215 [Streptomyces sp. NPDC020807]|uniref:hypothetical protein n=1 Tax=Streptomyces sp. NPDC020807 TaxID=3155119 RepID=UPI0033D755A2
MAEGTEDTGSNGSPPEPRPSGPPSGGASGPPSGPPSGPLNGPLNGPSPRRPERRWPLLAVLLGGIGLVVGVIGILVGAGAFDSDSNSGGGQDPGQGQATQVRTEAAPTPAQASAPTPPSAPPSTPPSASASSADGTHAFGETWKFPDGVEVTVSAPRTFTPTQGASGHKTGNKALAVEVAVRNGAGERLDLDTVAVRARDAGGRELADVFDAEAEPPMLGFHGSLLTGRKAVGAYGFDLPPGSADRLDVEVSVGFTQPSAFWSGPVP